MERTPLRRLWRENGLSLVLLALFLLSIAGQVAAGYQEHAGELREHGRPAIDLPSYVRSGHFLEAVFENWESEFLQMGMFVLLAAKLRQKGSAESKSFEDEQPEAYERAPGVPWPVRRGGAVLRVYEHSLSIALFGLFALSFALHAVQGLRLFNEERQFHGEGPASLPEYLFSSRFWFESLQNWQSEFASVLAIVLLSIVLREKESSQSKRVSDPHAKTGH